MSVTDTLRLRCIFPNRPQNVGDKKGKTLTVSSLVMEFFMLLRTKTTAFCLTISLFPLFIMVQRVGTARESLKESVSN